MLARWAKIGGEEVERHDQLDAAFANRFGENWRAPRRTTYTLAYKLDDLILAKQEATTMDIVILARRCAKISEEKLKRDDQLNAAVANMFGEKINKYKLV